MAKTNRTSTTHQPSEAQVRAFIAGRDLAADMLEHGRSLEGRPRDDGPSCGDVASIEARYRSGHPQDNWARGFLQRLIENPTLLDGFAGVLSDELVSGGTDLDLFRRLTPEQMRPEWYGQGPRAAQQ